MISFNMDALIKADAANMKTSAKAIINDFSIFIDIVIQIKLKSNSNGRRNIKGLVVQAMPYIGETRLT